VSDRLISFLSDHRRHSVLSFPPLSLSDHSQKRKPQPAMSLKQRYRMTIRPKLLKGSETSPTSTKFPKVVKVNPEQGLGKPPERQALELRSRELHHHGQKSWCVDPAKKPCGLQDSAEGNADRLAVTLRGQAMYACLEGAADQPALRGSGIFRWRTQKLSTGGQLHPRVREQHLPEISYDKIDPSRMTSPSLTSARKRRRAGPPRELGIPFAATEPSSDPPWPNHDPIQTWLTRIRNASERAQPPKFRFAPLPQHAKCCRERASSLRISEEGEAFSGISVLNSSYSGKQSPSPTIRSVRARQQARLRIYKNTRSCPRCWGPG